MEIALTPDMQRFVDDKVRVGRYESAQDVIRAGLAILMQQDAIESLPTEELEAIYPGLQEKLAEGLRDLREGRVTDGEAFFDQLDREDDLTDDGERKSA